MDIAEFKKYTIPEIRAGKMVESVRKTMKEFQNAKQDKYVKQIEAYKPLIETIGSEAVNQAITYPPPQQAITDGPVRGSIIADPNHGFTEEELLMITQKYKLPSPEQAFHEKVEDDALYDSGELNRSLGREKGLLTRKGRQFNQEEITQLTEDIETLRKYRNRLSIIKGGRETLTTGKGMVYFNNPQELLSRLELLGGSIQAGNNSVRNEFSEVAHKLQHLGTITKKQLSQLLNNYIL